MTKYNIKIYSKNKKLLQKAFKVLKISSTNIKNLQRDLIYVSKKKERKRISILKSPHVNKKAQEQFQKLTYKATVTFFSRETRKSSIFLKKIKTRLFSGAKIKIERTYSHFRKSLKISFTLLKNSTETVTIFFSFKQRNLLTTTTQCKKKKLLEKTLKYFKKLDAFGIQKRDPNQFR